MNAQLQEVIRQLEAAQQQVDALAASLSEEAWIQRKNPQRWCIAENIAHLNLTAKAYLPLLHKGISDARKLGGTRPSRYRRDLLGWILWHMIAPPARFKVKTPAPFVPAAIPPRGALLREFEQLQDEQIQLARAADGLPIQRVRLTSPFDARMKYSIYSTLTILPQHQFRHLLQAEENR